MSVAGEFSGINVGDMLQMRKKKQFVCCCCLDMLLHMCSIWEMRPSRRCSVTFSIVRHSSDTSMSSLRGGAFVE